MLSNKAVVKNWYNGDKAHSDYSNKILSKPTISLILIIYFLKSIHFIISISELLKNPKPDKSDEETWHTILEVSF